MISSSFPRFCDITNSFLQYESEIFIQSVCDDLEWAEIVYSLNSNQIFVPGATSVSGLLVDEETSFSSFGIVGDVNQALIIRVIGLSADEPLKVTSFFFEFVFSF